MLNYVRTHTCGELRAEDFRTYVVLSGWVHKYRNHGGLIFIDIRDRYGLTQLVFDPDKFPQCHAIAEKIRLEWVITIRGEVVNRAEGLANPNLKTGDIEVIVNEITVLSRANPPPITISDDYTESSEETKLTYRYLDMRRGAIAKNLHLRHAILFAMRSFLNTRGFLEITTPILAKSTPEGARDYLIPSRIYPGNFYALPQSPQLFKQLLMIGGMDKYFQIATCFRDEDLRANRQPEFTQLDMEMSFQTPDTLFALIEELLASVCQECLEKKLDTPFPRLSYKECMARYGTDKPDVRYGMELVILDDIAERSTFSIFLKQLQSGNIVKGLCVKGGADISRKYIDEYISFVGTFGIRGLAWMKMQDGALSSSITKFFSPELQQEIIERMKMENGDILFIISDTKSLTNQGLDHLRRKLADDRGLSTSNELQFLWVTEYPLFSWNEEEQRYDTEHHPFTAPHYEDLDLLESDPLKVRSTSFDLVLNGHELASGSLRIHDSKLQEKIFEILKLSPQEIRDRFGFFIEALQYGTPPHIGLAIGLERLLMILSGTNNIRDVIAFPKTQKAADLMLDAPSVIDKTQLDELYLSIKG